MISFSILVSGRRYVELHFFTSKAIYHWINSIVNRVFL